MAEGGLAVWAELDRKIDPIEVAAASAKGLFISDGSAYDYPGLKLNAIRMGFASSDINELRKSLGILKALITR